MSWGNLDISPLGLSCPPNVKQLNICDKVSDNFKTAQAAGKFISM